MEADYSSLEAINLRKNIQTTWHIPLTNTMILSPLADKVEKLQEKDINFYELDGSIFSDPYYAEHMIKGYIETEKITGEKFLCLVFMDENDFSLHNILPFKLKSNYNNKSKNKVNNYPDSIHY